LGIGISNFGVIEPRQKSEKFSDQLKLFIF
jgi:hypothetical protein